MMKRLVLLLILLCLAPVAYGQGTNLSYVVTDQGAALWWFGTDGSTNKITILEDLGIAITTNAPSTGWTIYADVGPGYTNWYAAPAPSTNNIITNIINGGTSGSTGKIERTEENVTVTFPDPGSAPSVSTPTNMVNVTWLQPAYITELTDQAPVLQVRKNGLEVFYVCLMIKTNNVTYQVEVEEWVSTANALYYTNTIATIAVTNQYFTERTIAYSLPTGRVVFVEPPTNLLDWASLQLCATNSP